MKTYPKEKRQPMLFNFSIAYQVQRSEQRLLPWPWCVCNGLPFKSTNLTHLEFTWDENAKPKLWPLFPLLPHYPHYRHNQIIRPLKEVNMDCEKFVYRLFMNIGM